MKTVIVFIKTYLHLGEIGKPTVYGSKQDYVSQTILGRCKKIHFFSFIITHHLKQNTLSRFSSNKPKIKSKINQHFVVTEKTNTEMNIQST